MSLMEKRSAGVRDYILVNEREKMVEWFAVMKQYVPEMYDSIISLIGDTPHYEMKAYWSVADFAGGALVMVFLLNRMNKPETCFAGRPMCLNWLIPVCRFEKGGSTNQGSAD